VAVMKENPRFTRDASISNRTEEGEGSRRQEEGKGGERGRRRRGEAGVAGGVASPPRVFQIASTIAFVAPLFS
jgi:hypothetical protein